MDLVGKTLYIVKGNLRAVERGYKEQFDVDIIETKIVKEILDPMIYARTVMGYQTEDVVFRNNWFCEEWLDVIDDKISFYFRVLDKNHGTQTVITLSKEDAIKYKIELMRELDYTVSRKYRKLRERTNEILSSSKNLVYTEIVLAMERITIKEYVTDKNSILSEGK